MKSDFEVNLYVESIVRAPVCDFDNVIGHTAKEQATLGKWGSEIHHPNGVATASLAWTSASMSHNPVGVENSSALLPRVARSSQPWALMRNPVGIGFGKVTPLGFIKPCCRPQDDRKSTRLNSSHLGISYAV